MKITVFSNTLYLQASVEITKLLIDFDVTFPSLRLRHRDLGFSSIRELQVIPVHLLVMKVIMYFHVFRY